MINPAAPFIYFDIDDTLVMWTLGITKVSDPIKAKKRGISTPFVNPYNGRVFYLEVHNKHVELLKSEKELGNNVIVWSAGGALWAKEVVQKLKLEPYVDLILSKPEKFYDDLPAYSFMPEEKRTYWPFKKE